jgi:adenylate kinase family enzyme
VADLAAVRWIGGGSGAGKSTVAGLLGQRLGLPVVHSDLSLHAHAAAAAGRPRVDAFVRMSMDERWVDRTPAEMLRTFPWFAGEGFELLLDSRPHAPVVVEGFRVLPERVAPLGGTAVWLLPTPERRETVMRERERERERAFWLRTSDPDRALANLLERDRLFTERLRLECAELGMPTIDVDGSEPIETVADRVERALGRARQQDRGASAGQDPRSCPASGAESC